MLPQAAEDRSRNRDARCLRFCAGLDFEGAGVDPLEGAPILGKWSQARCAHEPCQFLLNGLGNRLAVAASKAVQCKFLNVDLNPVTSDE